MKAAVGLLFAVSLCAVVAARQQPPRDATAAAAAVANDTASLSGVVVTSDTTPAPVRRAIVTITAGELSAARGAITDDDGRFEIEGLPAGRFTVTVSKAGFVTSAYGATKPGRPGVPVVLAAGQHRTDVRVALVHGGVITGTIRGADGQPLSGIQVIVNPAAESMRGGMFGAPEDVFSDDRGVFRAYGLSAGRYLVAALPKAQLYGETARRTDDQVDAQLQELQAQSAVRPGMVAGQPAPRDAAPAAPARKAGAAYTAIYYPGTPRQAQASPVDITEGEERSGIDFVVTAAPTANIEGTIVGQNPGGPVPTLTITGADGQAVPLGFSAAPIATTQRLGPDGRFGYVNVAPGRYTISARAPMDAAPAPAAPPGPPPQGGGGGRGSAAPPQASAQIVWAMATVEVSGGDVTGLVLELRPGLGVSGKIVFDGPADAAPKDLTGIRVSINPTGVGGSAAINTTSFGRPQRPSFGFAKPDSTFSVVGLVPGTYTMTATLPASAPSNVFWLRSAVLDGKDLLDGPFDIADSGDLSGVALTFSDRHNRLAGRLESAAGTPAADYFIVVYPADRALRSASRRVVSTRPATDGRYAFADLPPGDYLIAALTDVAPNEWRALDFLDQLVASSIHATVAESGDTTQDLRLQ